MVDTKMTVEELAESRTYLQERLRAISMSNTFGRSKDDMIALNLDQIKTQKLLFETEKQIKDYIEGRTANES